MRHGKSRLFRFLAVTLLALAWTAFTGTTITHGRAIQPDTHGATGSSRSVIEEPGVCEFTVDVSPYQVNIESGGSSHDVRILTYTPYSNTAEVFVYLDPPADGQEPIDPVASDDVIMTRDSLGHLIVKIELTALQDAALAADAFHAVKIVAVLKQPVGECVEKEGTGQVYVIDHNGP
jgi:hypothetical protein